MRRVTTDNQDQLQAWISKELGGDAPKNIRCIGQEIDGEIKAVSSYSGFKGKSCNFSLAGNGNFMSKDFLWAMFDYPFNKLKLKVIIATISGINDKSLKLSRHLGFEEVATIADAHEDGDLVIMVMRRENCKWLQINAPLNKLGV
jgi:L-amino acid N-acyltransferase YncA